MQSIYTLGLLFELQIYLFYGGQNVVPNLFSV